VFFNHIEKMWVKLPISGVDFSDSKAGAHVFQPVAKLPKLLWLDLSRCRTLNVARVAAILKESTISQSRIQQVLSSITADGYDTLYGFVEELLTPEINKYLSVCPKCSISTARQFSKHSCSPTRPCYSMGGKCLR